MLNVIVMGSMIVSLLVPAATFAAEPVEEVAAPGGISIEVVAVNGSGCPAGTASAQLSVDGSFFRISGITFSAAAGGKSVPSDSRKNCQVSVFLKKPAGWTFAVTRVDASGYVALAAGATAVNQTSLYFQGQSATAAVTRSFTGAVVGPWRTSDAVSSKDRLYAPCDDARYLNINMELRVDAGSSADAVTSRLTRDPVSTFRLDWKRC